MDCTLGSLQEYAFAVFFFLQFEAAAVVGETGVSICEWTG
jgi:hypothetical protein